jgi:HK97 family phage major capsid protein
MLTEEKVAAGFRAEGERIDGVEQDMFEIRKTVDQLAKLLKTYSRAFMTGHTETGEKYNRFWPTEQEAKAFGELFLIIAGRKDAGEAVMSEGGVLVPDELATTLIQKLGKYGKYRKNALIVPVGSDRRKVPKVESDLTVYAPGEGVEITEDDMVFSQVGLTMIKMCCLAAVSSELAEDSAIAIGEIIGTSMTRSMAKKEDLIGFLGDGTATYFGRTGICGALLGVDETIGDIKGLRVATGNAYSEIALDDFEGTVAILPDDADDGAKWFVNRKFFFSVMYKLARAAGAADLFSILTSQKERYFMGYPVEFVSAMPSTEANSQICALLGDLSLGAYLGERRMLTIAKSEEVLFKSDQIAFRGTERVDFNAFGVGDTTEAGPIVGLITAAT